MKVNSKKKRRMRQSTSANQSKIKISEACIVPKLPLRSPYNCIICISMCRNPWMLTGERSRTPTRHTVACILYLDLEKLRHTHTFTLIFEKARGKKIKGPPTTRDFTTNCTHIKIVWGGGEKESTSERELRLYKQTNYDKHTLFFPCVKNKRNMKDKTNRSIKEGEEKPLLCDLLLSGDYTT